MQTPTVVQNGKTRLSWLARARITFLLVAVFGIVFFLMTMIESPELMFYEKDMYMFQKIQKEKYFVRTNACLIPAMLPLNDNIREFVFRPTNFKPCPHAPHSLLTHNYTHIMVTKNVRTLNYYNITDINKLRCCYASFYRPHFIRNINLNNIDDRIAYSQCVHFKKYVKVHEDDEFVRVHCEVKKFTEVYNRFFIFAPKKKLLLYDGAKPISNDKPSFNVLILGIDNVSRLNFHRTMPKTLEFLKQRGGVELLGYNKVGDNSFPNIVPLLMGHDHRELKKMCHPMKQTYYDDCPFIWHWYKEAGYYTAFGEDDSYLGTFNYFMNGFRKAPTDYYMRPFVMEAQRKARKVKLYNTWLCINELYLYQVFLNYIERLTKTLKSSKMFGFFWEVTISHDNVNFPMFLDNDYVQLLERLESSQYLNKTVLLVMSDHGTRWGSIRKTRQGYFEERLPLAYFLMPNTFKSDYSEAFINLKSNSRRLTTPFDIHETLLDLIDLNNIVDDKINKRSKEIYANKRGISLFLPIYGNRTCESAGIDDHWCSCHERVPISKESQEAVNASKYLVQSLNTLLSQHPECLELSVSEIIKVEEIKANISEKVNSSWREFTLTVRVEPSDGIFEGTVRDDWKVVGTVSRLNLYGNQSRCVHDPQLKLYCYCESYMHETENENTTFNEIIT